MYFMIKDENIFDKYLTIWEKVSNTIKKINSKLVCNNKYLKAEKKKPTQNKPFNFFINQYCCLIQLISSISQNMRKAFS